MQVFDDPARFQAACLAARRGGDLGFVPTMGYLHEGHEQLMRRAATHATGALSIFVNPTQFGPAEDLARYPRDLPGDLAKAQACGISLVLAPGPAAMYPEGFGSFVDPGPVAEPLEGERRPGHFRGVATVVMKLLQLAQPTHAYFGEKDWQQLAVVRRIVRDFDVPCEVVGVPTVREADGLARSSRNVYLSAADRQRAPCLWRAIEAARAAVAAGERDPAQVEAAALEQVRRGADRIDYVAVRDARSILPVPQVVPGQAVLLLAAYVGRTRLIDNAAL